MPLTPCEPPAAQPMTMSSEPSEWTTPLKPSRPRLFSYSGDAVVPLLLPLARVPQLTMPPYTLPCSGDGDNGGDGGGDGVGACCKRR